MCDCEKITINVEIRYVKQPIQIKTKASFSA